jgi:ankyrin repeat protein
MGVRCAGVRTIAVAACAAVAGCAGGVAFAGAVQVKPDTTTDLLQPAARVDVDRVRLQGDPLVHVDTVRLQADPSSASRAALTEAFLAAVKDGDRNAALTLLRRHVEVNAAEPDGTTALQWAVRHDDLDLVDRLLRGGADAGRANRYGVTPMYLACLNGSAPMIERLLKAGIDANATVDEGETALMTAARTGSVDGVRTLLAHGAAIDTREPWRGQTALMWATAERHPDVVRELVAKGADVNARSAMQHWERQVTKEPREKWLPPGGLTPLLFASREGCLECARLLVDAGAGVNDADPDGITPMLSAIINGHYDAAMFLLDNGADPNLADVSGRTPLYAAVDFNTMPASNRPAPRVVANQASSLDLIAALLDRGANPNARLKKQQPYRTKLDRGDDTMLGGGTTPLIRAARAGDIDAMRLLLQHGADPGIATGSDTPNDVSSATRRLPGGVNPLMAAAGVGTKEEDTVGRKKTEAQTIAAIQLCLDAGVDINAADGRGQTALHGAATQGYDEVIRFLVEHGAKLDAKDGRGLTPLDAAEGRAGGFGFGGNTGNPHPSTAKLIRDLMAAQ